MPTLSPSGWHVGDLKPDFSATVRSAPGAAGLDLTGRTARFNFRRPDGTVFSKTATLANQGISPGVLTAVIAAGDFNQTGRYGVEVELDPGSSPQTIGPATFDVLEQYA